jgi:beta-lactam-binding protein with PASTA domain
VPKVIGMSVSDATTALMDAGLTVAGVQGNPNGTADGTEPLAGATVDAGSSVTILAQ